MSAICDLYKNIETMAAKDDLAAVLIHFNDTYLLEGRCSTSSELPGMARILTLIRNVRKCVSDACRGDRTLVLHSGDFLMPSRLGLGRVDN